MKEIYLMEGAFCWFILRCLVTWLWLILWFAMIFLVLSTTMLCVMVAIVCLGSNCSDLSVELPFTLTHPKPPETPPPSRPASANPQGGNADQPVDTNLIQLDTKYVRVTFAVCVPLNNMFVVFWSWGIFTFKFLHNSLCVGLFFFFHIKEEGNFMWWFSEREWKLLAKVKLLPATLCCSGFNF